jgi:type IV pilus assembly protein PilC
MPTFIYTAVDYAGVKTKGEMDAKDREAVVNTLRKSQLIIVSLREAKEGESNALGRRKGKVKLNDLVVFTRQLAALVKAGVPLVRGLHILSGQIESQTLREVITSMITKIEGGASLSSAMTAFPYAFTDLYVNMIKAGEFSGALDNILDRLASYLEGIDSLNRKVRGAFMYPVFIVVVAGAITSVIFIKVIPGFKNIFDSMGAQLPLPTLIVFKMSEIMRNYYLFVAIGAVALFFGVKRLLRVKRFQYTFDGWKLNAPLIGKLVRKVVIARFARTLSTLLKSGVSILAAMDISGKTSGNKVVEEIITTVGSHVSKGERIGESLSGNKVFPPLVVNLIAVGEETGDIDPMLEKIAYFYEEEVNVAVSGLTAMMEPAIIVVLGVVIGGVVIAMFLPIMQITQLVGR